VGPERTPAQLRVLQVTPSLAARDGGPSVAVMAINHALQNRGMASSVCSTDAAGRHGRLSAIERAQILKAGDVRLFRVHWPRRMKTSIGLAVYLGRRILRSDLLHIHYLNVWSSLAAAVCCKILNKPYVVQPHGGLEPYDMAKNFHAKAIFELISGTVRSADALILATETEAARIPSVPPIRKFVLPLGAPHVTLTAPSQATETPTVIFLGRLAPVKRVDILLRAWALVVDQIPAARLNIVGPDTDGLLDGYRELVSSLGLHGAVRFSGELVDEEKFQALVNASLFVLPSENESFGMAVAEALSAGVPVILSENVGIAGDVQAAGAGLIVPSVEPDHWANAVVSLLKNEPARKAMSEAATRLAFERYSWDQVAVRLEHLYRRILSQR
jgi:glycosyltransferase involved in cell wall biosynthesis